MTGDHAKTFVARRTGVSLRHATAEDIPLLLSLIASMAAFEKLEVAAGLHRIGLQRGKQWR